MIPPANRINTTIRTDWFDYMDQDHYYIDFAHATHFGGSYRGHGNVQEERMFVEFPALPLLEFKTNNGIHPCVIEYDSNGKEKSPPMAKPSPFIIESINREYDISGTPYGGAIFNAQDSQILKGIKKVNNSVPVNIIGLAAENRKFQQGVPYSLKDQLYHFEAAYLGFSGAKRSSCSKKSASNTDHSHSTMGVRSVW